MEQGRRRFIRSSGGLIGALLAAGVIAPREAKAAEWNKVAFEAKDLEQIIRALGGEAPAQSDAIDLVVPEIAENGAVVPVGVSSRLPDTQAIVIVVEKNPNPLAAVFTLPAGTLADLQTRVKMAETCKVFALVKAAGRYAYTAKEVKVTLGGCGG